MIDNRTASYPQMLRAALASRAPGAQIALASTASKASSVGCDLQSNVSTISKSPEPEEGLSGALDASDVPPLEG